MGLEPSSYEVTAPQNRWHLMGHLQFASTDHQEGISASLTTGQTQTEMATHIIAVPLPVR